MNKAKLKAYAPQARKDFIAVISARANQLGIAEQAIAPAEKRGDILIIEGREWPASIGPQRDRLIKKIAKEGFAQTMEAVAYTWFNRIAALRYMEIHDYLGHGHRVLSSRDGGLPEALRHTSELSLTGLNLTTAQEMQLAGNRDGELFKLILVAQCNALSTAMPFLFEHIDDETELLLPDNLLRTDSIIAKLIEAIPEEDWQQVEIIGWLYQFYISDKKDEVIGKVVKSEDIPAATQLFTPNWIVQYLVQNSVGRLWMMANPTSTLKSQWPYYIEPAEQTPEVQAQLEALIQTRMGEDGGSLNPETITVLDPACGSGHILVEAYEVLKSIYLERGYQPRSIPRLILEKNLYGLDIDDRAAQMAGFALLMKARADDRRLFDSPLKLNVLSMQESKGLDLDELFRSLQPFGIERGVISALIETFVHAKTFGSLIQISDVLVAALPKINEGLISARGKGDVFARMAAEDLIAFTHQALVLSMKFDSVVANPPYMGMRGMFPLLKNLAKDLYPDAKADLFSMFIDRARKSALPSGYISMVTMHSWMFLSSFETFRANLLASSSIMSLTHFGPRAFAEISGEVVQTVAFTLLNQSKPDYVPSFLRLVEGGEETKSRALRNKANCFENISQLQLRDIPGSPIAYWVGEPTRAAFSKLRSLAEIAKPRQGLATSDNGRFLRLWHEVELGKVGFGIQTREDSKRSEKRWFPCQKGGPARRWYGNHDWLVNWEDDGKELTEYAAELYGSATRTIKNMSFYFRAGISWSTISTAAFAMRYSPEGFISETKGAVCFLDDRQGMFHLLALTNTKLVDYFLKILSPTLDYHEGPVGRLPILETSDARHAAIAMEAVELTKHDWDASETSWDFQSQPLIAFGARRATLGESWNAYATNLAEKISRLKDIEEENNHLFILSYGMQDYISPDVSEDQITLSRPSREKDSKSLVSYAVGCMMGRFSLDETGLIFANAGNVGFDGNRYKTFPADADGIVPLTDEQWFEDDASNRIREFLRAVWGAETLEENMAWLAESLGQKTNETPDETIRRYVAGSFYKDHLQIYKKRPIYWLFSSGKQGAFQCLVYLHRYHEGTLSRMRAEYVVPLTAKIAARIDLMNNDAEAASSAAARTKTNKLIEGLRKKQTELLAFDEKLRHYADMRIKLDLDDGVKANYGKFGDLLDSVKAITGGAGDD